MASQKLETPMQVWPRLAATDLKDLGYTFLHLTLASFSPGGAIKRFGCEAGGDCTLKLRELVDSKCDGRMRGGASGGFRTHLARLHLRSFVFAHPPISPICRTPLFPYLTF